MVTKEAKMKVNRIPWMMSFSILFCGGILATKGYSLGSRPQVNQMTSEKEANFSNQIRQFQERREQFRKAAVRKANILDQRIRIVVPQSQYYFVPPFLEKELNRKRIKPNSFLFPNSCSGFCLVQATLPDLYLYLFGLLDPGCPVEPRGDAFKIHLSDFNHALPIAGFPKDLEIIGGYRAWNTPEARFTPFDYETRFSSEAEELQLIQGAKTVTVPMLSKTLQLYHFTPFENNELPEVRLFELNDGSRWDIHDLDLYLVLIIDPGHDVREGESEAVGSCEERGGEGNNRYIFRWLGADNLDTEEEDFPPGFYYLGPWCPRPGEI